MIKATYREVFEETGLIKEKVNLGSVVWERDVELLSQNLPILVKQKFIVGRSNETTLNFTNFVDEEKIL